MPGSWLVILQSVWMVRGNLCFIQTHTEVSMRWGICALWRWIVLGEENGVIEILFQWLYFSPENHYLMLSSYKPGSFGGCVSEAAIHLKNCFSWISRKLFKNPHWHQSLSEFEFWVHRVPQHLSAHLQGHLEMGSNPISVPCWGEPWLIASPL